MRTLYFRPGRFVAKAASMFGTARPSAAPGVIIEAVRLGRLRLRNHLECALRDLLAAHLQNATTAPISVIMPAEPRALAVARMIALNPADPTPLASLCANPGVSVRTVQRIYRKELGIDIDTWCRQV